MINASPNALLLVDTQGKINFLNKSAEKLFGYTNDELKGKEISVLVPDKHQSVHNNHVDNYSKQPSKKIMAEESNPFARKKNGSLFPVEIVLNPIVTTASTYILASIIDISERIKVIDEKRKNDELFRIVVESAPNAIILLVNETGNMTLVNRQAEHLFGYKREELVGQNIEILLPERYKSGHRDLVKMFFHNPQTRPMGAGRDLFAVKKDRN
jgi:PAS domain S-box-containing protein